MAVDVLTEITIDRSIEVVADFAAEPSNAPEWYVNIDSIIWKTDPPLTVGLRWSSSRNSSGGACSTHTR